MARRLRLHVPGGFYHVTLRGNHQQPVFFRDADRLLLDSIIADAIDALDARVHAYCWMTNHIHMLVQVSDQPLGRVIHRIASRYARKVQARLRTTGHLFERRYHGVLVDSDRYLLAVVRYIHLNPVEAALVDRPCRYRWSSHRAYLGMSVCDWLTTSHVLATIAAGRQAAMRGYRRLFDAPDPLQDEVSRSFANASHGAFLGDDGFGARAGAQRPGPRSNVTLDDLLRECSRRFAVAIEALASRSRARGLSAPRAWVAHKPIQGSVCSLSAVARRLGRSESSMRELMARHPWVPTGAVQ